MKVSKLFPFSNDQEASGHRLVVDSPPRRPRLKGGGRTRERKEKPMRRFEKQMGSFRVNSLCDVVLMVNEESKPLKNAVAVNRKNGVGVHSPIPRDSPPSLPFLPPTHLFFSVTIFDV